MAHAAVEVTEGQVYTDRFGNTWSVRLERKRGKSQHLVFTCGSIQLQSAEDGETNSASTGLKDVFCDAERVLEHDNELWYVGYRSRANTRGSRAQAGVCTRFRSESGRVRYSKTMLHFRHMPEAELCKHLTQSQVASA